MFTLLFVILMVVVFGKLIGLAFRMTWGLTKVIVNLVLLPLVLIGLVIGGLVSVALPLLIVVGIASLIFSDR